MIVVQPDVELVLRQVGGVFSHQPGVVMFGFSDEDPAHVGPPSSVARRMGVAGMVGLLVVNPMGRDPENGAALQSEGSAEREEVFEGEWDFIRTVGMQPVVAQTD